MIYTGRIFFDANYSTIYNNLPFLVRSSVDFQNLSMFAKPSLIQTADQYHYQWRYQYIIYSRWSIIDDGGCVSLMKS